MAAPISGKGVRRHLTKKKGKGARFEWGGREKGLLVSDKKKKRRNFSTYLGNTGAQLLFAEKGRRHTRLTREKVKP